MHELGITQNILQIALEHAAKANAQKIRRINLVVGSLAGVVAESVQFYFDFLSKDTPAEGARLVFEKVPGRLRCQSCGREFAGEEGDWSCPGCRMPGPVIVSGREFYVESIEVE